jgi:benzoyl-CoA 2,3-dioxygenase component A
LQKLPRALIQVELAFSRQPGHPREYVQDRMRSRSDDVARFLRDVDSCIYLCGHKKMEEGVRAAFAEICRAQGLDWPSLESRLRANGRLHVETY